MGFLIERVTAAYGNNIWHIDKACHDEQQILSKSIIVAISDVGL